LSLIPSISVKALHYLMYSDAHNTLIACMHTICIAFSSFHPQLIQRGAHHATCSAMLKCCCLVVFRKITRPRILVINCKSSSDLLLIFLQNHRSFDPSASAASLGPPFFFPHRRIYCSVLFLSASAATQRSNSIIKADKRWTCTMSKCF
jgi:hypothetical protein